jgi:glycosyltransferase involved in cell wall biosynthesis
VSSPPSTAGAPVPAPPAGAGGRVLFVLEYFPPHVGGVETLFGHLTGSLARAGYRVSVVTAWLPGTERRERWHGVEVCRVRVPGRGRRYWFSLLAIPAALRAAWGADLIHTTTYSAALPAWLGAFFARKPAVLTVHEVFGPQWHLLPGVGRAAGLLHRLLEWGVLHLPFAAYLCDSDFTRRRLARFTRVPAKRTAVVYPAVDYGFWGPQKHRPRPFREELGLAPDTFLYLYFGRPGVSKGLEYLLAAAARVREALPRSRLVLLLGRDPAGAYRRLHRQVVRLGLQNHVVLLDPVPREDLPGYLLASDCVVVPSVSEGFGYSAVEAAALGCRVVATSGHAVQEVLGGGALLVPPRDPPALATALLAVARHEWSPASAPRGPDQAAHLAGVTAVYRRLTRKALGRGGACGTSATPVSGPAVR